MSSYSTSVQHNCRLLSTNSYGFFGNNIADQLMRKECADAKSWFHFTSLEDLADLIARTPLLFQPGSHFHYGLSTDVLGRVIEIVSHQRLDEFFHKEIFLPLQMKDTSFQVSANNRDRLAEVFEVSPGHAITKSTNDERDRFAEPVLLSGGGGLVSSIDDYVKFMLMLSNRGRILHNHNNHNNNINEDDNKGLQGIDWLISERCFHAMTCNQLPNNGDLSHYSFESSFSEVIGAGFGFGFAVSVLRDPSIARGAAHSHSGEFGWGGVAATNFHIDVNKGVSMIFLTSLVGGASVYPIRAQFKLLGHRFVDAKLQQVKV